jgi:Protein of unknown function (DUF2809)
LRVFFLVESNAKMLKTRLKSLLIAILLIPFGLATRHYGNEWMKLYAGDVLWAAMIYWGFRFLLVHKPKKTAFCALAFCFLIECSQLYHATWIDQIRHTLFGGLVLGFGFLWSDLVCYSVGVLGSYWVDNRFFQVIVLQPPAPFKGGIS